MADRISDERLAQMKPHAIAAPTSEIGKLVAEAVQSRALVAELRSVVEEMRSEDVGWVSMYADKLDSLLSAHTEAKP